MKIALLLAFAFVTTVATAQTQLSYCYNAAQTNRPEFSYNVTVKIQKNAGETDAKRYTTILVQAMPDAKGFYNPSDNKLYSCSQLGNICNPNNFNLISVQIAYYCNGEKKIASATFRSLNEQRYLALVLGAGGKFCESFDFFELKVVGAGLNPAHLGQIKDKISQLGGTKPSATGGFINPMTNAPYSPNSTAKPVAKPSPTTTGIPANTSGNDPLAHFETDGKVKTNPMVTNTNTGVSAVDNFNKGYQQGQQIAVAVLPLAQSWVDAHNKRVDAKNAEFLKEREIRENKERQLLRNKFQAVYMPLVDKAVAGDENTRLILYYASLHLYSTEYVRQRENWLNEAFRNNNLDAILEKADKAVLAAVIT